jgi:hypothetical protein
MDQEQQEEGHEKDDRDKKDKKDRLVPGDPPILVGGGGSSYVWLKDNQGRRRVDPRIDDDETGIKPGSPKPQTRTDYEWCSRVSTNPRFVYFHDGTSLDAQGNPAETRLEIQDRKDWYVRIE